MGTTTIWFHGTSAQAAEEILRTGFRDGTYFAAHLEDALAFGGDFVFLVVLPFSPDDLVTEEGWDKDRAWQVRAAARVEQIVRLTEYRQTVLHEFSERMDRVFEANRIRGASLNPVKL